MKGALPTAYYNHFVLLVISIRKLSSQSIKQEDLTSCRKLLDTFCKSHGDLYGENEMTINVHSLRHLVDNVEDLGPLWAYSAFNGTIFTTLSWHESHRRNNSTVQFTLNSSLNFGQIFLLF